jgi:lipid-binding SYLF domain-containing protein
MRRLSTLIVGTVAALAITAAPAAAQDEDDVAEVIQKFQEGDPGMQAWFREAYGYVVFPSVGKGAIGIGGARGKGLVYEQGRLVGKSTLTQVTIGFQLGGQAFSEVIFFKDKTALDDLVAVVTATKGGLMYEASVGGQKFDYEPIEG